MLNSEKSEINKERGDTFEQDVKEYLNTKFVQKGYEFGNKKFEIGGRNKKRHELDPVDEKNKIVIECKNIKWAGKADNTPPSAKLSNLNEAVLFMSFMGEIM